MDEFDIDIFEFSPGPDDRKSRDEFIEGEDEAYHKLYEEYEVEQQKQSATLAISSLVISVCGVLSIATLITLPLPVAGIVMGYISLRQKRNGRNIAIAGIIVSVISLVIFFIILFTLLSMAM